MFNLILMKSFVLHLLFLLSYTGVGFSQSLDMTILYDVRTNSPLKKITGNEEGVCIAVGSTSALRSEDYGNTWQQITSFAGCLTDNALFFNKDNCVVLGQKVATQTFCAFYSTNKGVSWIESQIEGTILGSSSSDLSSINTVFTALGNCIAVTGAGSVISSSDYGKNWKKISAFDGKYRLTNSLIRYDDNTLHAFRESEYFKSIDNGKSWISMPKIISDGMISSCSFKNDVIKVVANNSKESNCTILESSDNGQDWSVVKTVTTLENVSHLSFLDNETLIAFRTKTKSGFYISEDLGNTWTSYFEQQLPVQLYDIYFINENSMIVSGDRKSLFLVNKNTKETTTISLIKLQTSTYDIYVLRKKPDNSILFCDAATTSPVTSTDLGATWSQNEQIFGDANATDIYYRTKDNGYAIMSQQYGLMYETKDAGKTWTSMSSKLGKLYKSPFTRGPNFSFIDERTGVALVRDENNNTVFLFTNDGGETWGENVDTNFTFYSAVLKKFGDRTVLYASALFNENTSAYTQELTISSDFGKTWGRKFIADAFVIEDLHLFDENNILVVGRSGKKDSANHRRIYRSSNGGNSWNAVLRDNLASFPRTLAVENNICIAGCYEYDSLLVSVDYGISWKPYNYRPIQKLDQIKYSILASFIHNGVYYASGNSRSFFTPEPANSPFVAKVPLPSNLTDIDNVENTDPFARVWIFDVVPNPVTRRTRISLFCDPSVKQSLSVGLFNVQGMLVKDLTSDAEITPTGHGSLNFEADGVSSGMYLLKISGGGTTRTQLIAVIQ